MTIQDRLRAAKPDEHCNDLRCDEAADRIDALEAALRGISKHYDGEQPAAAHMAGIARAALSGEGE